MDIHRTYTREVSDHEPSVSYLSYLSITYVFIYLLTLIYAYFVDSGPLSNNSLGSRFLRYFFSTQTLPLLFESEPSLLSSPWDRQKRKESWMIIFCPRQVVPGGLQPHGDVPAFGRKDWDGS